MNLFQNDSQVFWPFVVSYRDDGMAVLRGVLLPDTFEPTVTDAVFFRAEEGRCEVYLGTNAIYGGESPTWRAIQERPEAAGQTRLVLDVQGDLLSAVNALRRLLEEAGGDFPATATLTSPFEARPFEAQSRFAQGVLSPEALTNLEAVSQAMENAGLSIKQEPAALNEESLYAALAQRVRGQDAALHTLCSRVCRHLARTTPRRPATLLAVGPTGVGKTRSAEALVEVLGDLLPARERYSFLRLDMSEYSERHRISQLLGAPQGYIGHGEGAQLVDALAANPRTVVLFDEIEKAHPDVWRALMNAMDAGRLSRASTGRGQPNYHQPNFGRATEERELERDAREIDCRRAVFLFTTNLDASGLLRELQETEAFENARVVDAACRRRLQAQGVAPELVGRIGAFLVYRPLDARARAEVVTLAIARVGEEYGLQIARIEPDVIACVLREVGDGQFGARPDEYLVDEMLGTAFAQASAQRLQGLVLVRCAEQSLLMSVKAGENTESDDGNGEALCGCLHNVTPSFECVTLDGPGEQD